MNQKSSFLKFLKLGQLKTNEHTVMAILAVIVGLAAGLGAVGFRYLINFIQTVFAKVSIKLNSNLRLRNTIYKLYDNLRIIDFKLKSFVIKEKQNARGNIVYVNPNRIIFEKDLIQNNWRLFLKFIKPLMNPKISGSIEIINGNWDLKENLKLFEDDIKHKSYYMHFVEGMEWRDTPYYKREVKRYLKGNIRKDYKSIDDLNLKYTYHDKLFNKIKREGFKTQKQIIESEGNIINYGRGSIFRKYDDDITVGIGRDGEIIFFDGRHRLNVAKILNLNRIPVRVLVIHQEFLPKINIK